jgi:hypothetical protein
MRHTVTSCNYTWDSQMMSSMTSEYVNIQITPDEDIRLEYRNVRS